MRYIIFIYIRYVRHHLKKSVPQVRLSSQDPFVSLCTLNNYEFMVHHVPIYRKHLYNFNEEENL